MMIKKAIRLCMALVSLAWISACEHPIDKTLLYGNWRGVEWVVEGQTGMMDATLASFSFQPEGSYTYTYNDVSETGAYTLQNNELFTTPQGGVKMMVKVLKLTSDSLVFSMNRGGQAETLTLIHQ